MNSEMTELVFLLDASGSMSGLEADTMGGFNAMIAKQRKARGKALVSLVEFADTSCVVLNRVPLSRVRRLTARDYTVGGCTALLDALGGAMHHIGCLHRGMHATPWTGRTIFVITTDGQENASRHYDLSRVRHMVERQKNRYGWEFLFLGANMDAIAAAAGLGIEQERAVTYLSDEKGTALSYEAIGSAVVQLREEGRLSAGWSEKIVADTRRRGGRRRK